MYTTLTLCALTLTASAGCLLMALFSLAASVLHSYDGLTLLTLDTPPAPVEYGEVVPLTLEQVPFLWLVADPVVDVPTPEPIPEPTLEPTPEPARNGMCGRPTKAGTPCRSKILLANGHCRNHQ